MGYFSNLAVEEVSCGYDHSYTPPERQLLWRLEELQDKLEEFTVKRGGYEDRVCFSEADLRYVLPEDFKTVADVEAAIELAISDLEDRYGIRVLEEEYEEEDQVVDEIAGMQISFMDILAMSSCLDSAKVA